MNLPPFDASMATLAAVVFVAGLVRGFSGFGSGMIIMPAAAALFGPKTAIVIVLVVDSLPVLPFAIPALKIARWREVVPVLAGSALFIPIGLMILKAGDPLALRWFICTVIIVAVTILASGWRYDGPRGTAISMAVGALSGLLGGIASVPGPPPILYWMASSLAPAIIRANMLVLLFLGEFLSGANLWAAGLLTWNAVMLGVTAAPFYFAGLLAGWLAFPLASERVYRRIAFTMILLAALTALPLFDAFHGS